MRLPIWEGVLEKSSYYSGDNDEGLKKKKKASNSFAPIRKITTTPSGQTALKNIGDFDNVLDEDGGWQ